MTKIPPAVVDKEFDTVNVAAKYQEFRAVVISNFSERVWFMTEACASVIASLMLADLRNPIGLNLVDGPSSEKTTVLSFFYGLQSPNVPDIVYKTDNFTSASFVSHAANVKKKDLDKADLLPRIRYKCLVVPELAPTFGVEKDKLLENLSTLTSVFDGSGYWRDGGVHGGRGYRGDYLFAWLGATTPIRPSVWKAMGNLGSRFLFLTAEEKTSHSDEVREAVASILEMAPYGERVEACRKAVTEFFDYLSLVTGGKHFHRSIQWDARAENPAMIDQIGKLASVTARVRSDVSVWFTDGQSSENGRPSTDFTRPVFEKPLRLTAVLYGLARGHAILCGRRSVTEDEMPLIAAVSLSSMPDDRRRVLDLLISRDHDDKLTPLGSVTSTEVREILGYSKHAAHKVLNALDVLDVGDLTGGVGPEPLKLTLKPEYGWLTKDEFAAYRSVWESATAKTPELPF